MKHIVRVGPHIILINVPQKKKKNKNQCTTIRHHITLHLFHSLRCVLLV